MNRKITQKAFENQEYLNTRDARPIRILSEYLYPMHAFEKAKITDTVVFFGSSRITSQEAAASSASETPKNSFYYESARQLAGELTRWSRREAEPRGRRLLVCTGGGPGIMEASNRGAFESGGKSLGLNIELPMEQASNPYVSPELNFDFHYFFTRKYWLLYYARVLIVFPGGYGTLDELFETLTLQQTKNSMHPIPVVLFGKAFWERLIDFPFLAETGMIAEEDLDLFKMVDTVEEAQEFIFPVLSAALERNMPDDF